MIYLAYGSNLHFEQMGYRCPDAVYLGNTEVKDYELLFRSRRRNNGVATIEPKQGACVPACLWKISDSDEQSLDHYEGYPWLYRKETIKVMFNGEEVEAMVYIMNEEGHPITSPGAGYFATLYQGYHDCGLDTKVLKEAAAKCK